MIRKLRGLRLLALVVCAIAPGVSGCAFTLTDINTGVQAGRSFDDANVWGQSKTAWTWSLSGHFTRDKK